MNKMILVEVAYATPQKQLILELRVKTGTTALEAVVQSGITDEFPDINLKKDAMGIFSSLLDGKLGGKAPLPASCRQRHPPKADAAAEGG